MYMNGSGITSNTILKVHRNFTVESVYALTWARASNGNWFASDRGSDEDYYNAIVDVLGTQSYINNILEELYANRLQDNQLILSNFENNEDIWGPDIDYTVDITATATEIGQRVQRAYNSFTFNMTLRIQSPSFSGSASFPDLKYLNYGYTGDWDQWTIDKLDSYTSNFYYQDNKYDSGVFSGTFIMPDSDLIGLRRWIAANRGASYSLPAINGVDYPFGPNSSFSYPGNVKVLELGPQTRRDLQNWIINLRLAEVVS